MTSGVETSSLRGLRGFGPGVGSGRSSGVQSSLGSPVRKPSGSPALDLGGEYALPHLDVAHGDRHSSRPWRSVVDARGRPLDGARPRPGRAIRLPRSDADLVREVGALRAWMRRTANAVLDRTTTAIPMTSSQSGADEELHCLARRSCAPQYCFVRRSSSRSSSRVVHFSIALRDRLPILDPERTLKARRCDVVPLTEPDNRTALCRYCGERRPSE